MKVYLLLFFAAFVAGAALRGAQPAISHEGWEDISTEDLSKRLKNGDDFLLINVLPKIIHDRFHIPGSVNIPIGQLAGSAGLPEDKHNPLIFYCMGML